MNAVGYARFSSHNQTEKSIEAQVREISAFASVSGYNLIKIYADRAQSGYAMDRPEFQQMIKDSESGLFDTVIVHKFDRFGRDGDDAAYFERLLKLNGVKLISVEEKLDLETPEGVLLKRLLQGINEFYGKNLAREVMKGLKVNALKCLHTGGIPALGYNVNPDKTYSINETEAEAVRIIFNMYASGYGYGKIIDELNRRGYKTKAGRNFGKNSLHDILKNERYAGTYVFNKTASRGMQRKRNMHKYKDESEIIRIENGIPAIIDKELFQRVCNKMSQNKRRAGQYKAKVNYLLSGKVFCGECGSAMTGDTTRIRGTTYGYYVCNQKSMKVNNCTMKSIPQSLLEDAVIEKLNNKIFKSSNVDKICERIYISMNEKADNNEEIAKLRHEIAMLDKKIANGAKAILDGLDVPEFAQIVTDLSEKRRDLAMKIIELEEIPEVSKSLEEIKAEFAEYSDLGKLPYIQKRAVIERFVHKIFVYPTPSGDWKIRVIVSPENPTRELTDFLGTSGSVSPAPA